jgi:diguanylate cyclase (GGDEF)-like protein
MTFAACFLAIYLYEPSKKAPAILSIAYACGSLSLAIGFFRYSMEPAHATIITNILYTTTMFLTTTGIAVHYKNKAPLLLMSILAVMQASIMLYFIYWQPDITIRTIASNLTAAGLIACALFVIPRHSKLLIDRIMFWVVIAISIQFVLRTTLLMYVTMVQDVVLTDANYEQSIITTSLYFSISVFSVILAVTACIAFGMDAISDMKRIANSDVLSGLLNRRGFEIEARQIIATAQENNLPATMIVADLDNFKTINDTHGHIIGDTVIQEFGKLLSSSLRNGDISSRMGGEEFCILLHTADIHLGRLLAESIRTKMECLVFEAGENTFSMTASFGVAELGENENYNTLFIRADEELYNAKNAGRNQVRPKRLNYILKSVM